MLPDDRDFGPAMARLTCTPYGPQEADWFSRNRNQVRMSRLPAVDD
jgi:hypothetical protein